MDKLLPFLQGPLPVMITLVTTIWVTSWMQNKRLDEMSKRLDDIVARLGRIEALLIDHDRRITVLESSKWGR